MAKGSGELISVGMAAFGVLFVVWVATMPGDDQVCRPRKVWIMDAVHGVDGQPTCQELIDQVESQAVDALRRTSDLESRVSELESRLNM